LFNHLEISLKYPIFSSKAPVKAPIFYGFFRLWEGSLQRGNRYSTGNWQQAIGNWQRAIGNWQWAMGNGQLATGNRQ
jgi:hypothetical protein